MCFSTPYTKHTLANEKKARIYHGITMSNVVGAIIKLALLKKNIRIKTWIDFVSSLIDNTVVELR